jgi:CheY-like chemotaxis protein
MGKVLVIDDDARVRSVVRRLVEAEGHEVVEAENGKIGLERFESDPADLVITDIFMPEMDGIEVLVALRKRSPQTRLVAMSGGGLLPARDMLRTAEALGAVSVIEKPFDIEALREHLAALGPREEGR